MIYNKNMQDIRCEICDDNKLYQNLKGFSYHLRIKHNMNVVDYFQKFDENFEMPCCETCGKEFNFDDHQKWNFTRFMEKRFCNKKCMNENEDMKKKFSEGGIKGGKATLGRKHSKEWRENMSKIMVEKHKNGDQYHVGNYKAKCGKTYNYKSSWEMMYMKYLDENNDVISWKYEPDIELKYEFEGIERHYIIDFEVYYTNRKELVEVGTEYEKISNACKRVKRKLDSAKIYCEKNGYVLKIITEKNFGFRN